MMDANAKTPGPSILAPGRPLTRLKPRAVHSHGGPAAETVVGT
jgi:hypothetical protein